MAGGGDPIFHATLHLFLTISTLEIFSGTMARQGRAMGAILSGRMPAPTDNAKCEALRQARLGPKVSTTPKHSIRTRILSTPNTHTHTHSEPFAEHANTGPCAAISLCDNSRHGSAPLPPNLTTGAFQFSHARCPAAANRHHAQLWFGWDATYGRPAEVSADRVNRPPISIVRHGLASDLAL